MKLLNRIFSSSVYLILPLLVLTSCSNLGLKKKLPKETPYKVGILGFKITAPIKKIDEIKTLEKASKENKNVKVEIESREANAKAFFLDYMKRFKDVATVDIPISEVKWKEEMKISDDDLKMLKEKYGLDALVLGEVPWYGKTNIIYPIVGMTADIVIESIIIGVVTQWNWPIILGNVGLEIVTNAPLWFGGAYFFGQAFKPVTLEAKIYVFKDKIEEYESSFEASRARHMLDKYPKDDRKKNEFQLEASFRKVLKELAVEVSN